MSGWQLAAALAGAGVAGFLAGRAWESAGRQLRDLIRNGRNGNDQAGGGP